MNLHRMKEDLIASGRLEEFLQELPGFVVVKEELWTQVSCFVLNQKGHAGAALSFVVDRIPPGPQVERARERLKNAQRVHQALIDQQPLELEICVCWHTSNRGENGEEQKHPNGFNCRECQNTGKVQLK